MTQAACSEERINKVYQEISKKYFEIDATTLENSTPVQTDIPVINSNLEKKHIKQFLLSNCSCGHDCQLQFAYDELIAARSEFRALSTQEKNCYILGQLRLL